MSESKSTGSTNRGGISFCGMLAILFIGLKLTGYIDWSWVWVLSPLWIPVAAILAIFAACLLLAGLFSAIAAVLGVFDSK